MIWLGIAVGWLASTVAVLFMLRDRPLTDLERADAEDDANCLRYLVKTHPEILHG